MKFLDEAKIYIRSGDGGRGGDVVVEAVEGLNTLIDFRYQQHFKAARGEHGKGRNMTGAAGATLVIKVPVGTQILAEDKETLGAELVRPGQRVVLAKGGDGGFGNTRFKSSTNRAPRRADPGWPGEERWLWLRLKLIADAGLVGLPNAGKSTLLAAVSRARPKVADYPFTTLHPVLGVVHVHGTEFVLADIPGLIEGAHEGAGLGDRFLGHVERCAVLVHLVDGTHDDVAGAYRTIRGELTAYGHGLAEKPEVVALNKIDALSAAEADARAEELAAAAGVRDVLRISSASGAGMERLLAVLHAHVTAARAARASEQPAAAAPAAAWQP